MSNSWQTKKLAEICDKASSNISQNQLRNEDGEYPIFGAGGYIKNISFYHRDREYISIIKDGAGIGRVSLLPAKSSVIGTLQYLIPKENVDIKFLYYILNSFDFQKYKTGATIPHIYFKDYSKETFIVPPLAEQKQIVEKLDEVFEKMAKAKEAAEKNLQNAKELFESYLNNIFANPGKNWEEKRLGEVCDFVRGPFGGSLKKSIFKKEGYVVYEQQHAIYNQFTDVRYFIDEKKFSEMKRFELKAGDLIMSCSGTMGKIAIAPEDLKRGIINQALLKLSPNDGLYNEFLKYWMESGVFQDDLKIYTKGAAIKNVVSVKILKGIKLLVPKIQEQKAIVRKIKSFSTEVERLEKIYEQKLADLEELKKSLLSKAFKGELSLVASSVQKPVAVPSPYIRNQVHAAIVDQVVQDNGSTTEVAVAKYDHLLQELCGLPLGYQFATHQFGPFDNQIKRLVSSGLGKNKWFTKRSGMIVFGSNVSALLSRQSNLYRSAQASMRELSRLGITKLDADGIELLSTVCHTIKETGSTAIDAIRAFMSNWQTDNNARTKAEKFSEERTQKCLDFILKNNLHQKLLLTP